MVKSDRLLGKHFDELLAVDKFETFCKRFSDLDFSTLVDAQGKPLLGDSGAPLVQDVQQITISLVTAAADAPQAGTDAPDDDARFLRVRVGIEAGRIKPSLRAIYAAEGASQEVARRYLVDLEQAGVIERAGRGYALRATTAKKGGEA